MAGRHQRFAEIHFETPGTQVADVSLMSFMLSLADIPLTGGFIGKYLLFVAAIQAGLNGLAIIAVVTSVIAAFFYRRVIVDMFMRDAEPGHEVQPAPYRVLNLTVGFSALAVLVLGILPGFVLTLVQNAAQWLIAGAG